MEKADPGLSGRRIWYGGRWKRSRIYGGIRWTSRVNKLQGCEHYESSWRFALFISVLSPWCADRRKRLGLLVDLALLWELPGPVLYPPSVDLQSNIPLFMAHGSPSLLIEIMRFMMRKNEILQKVTQALVPFSGTWWYLANEIWS